MEVIQLEYPLNKSQYKPVVAAIGYFDGLHLGHQGVINRAIQKAKDANYLSSVITFNPHPREILKNGAITSYLTPLNDKLQLLKKMGIDIVYVIHFTWEFSQIRPEQFIEEVLLPLQIKEVIVGFDFRFGRGGSGTPDFLKKTGNNHFNVEIIQPIQEQELKISSSLIREKLQAGLVEEVNLLLYRPYCIKGSVIHGEKRGSLIGFPTANLQIEDRYLLPPHGVYGVRVTSEDRTAYGVMNIGYKPTFHEDTILSVEVHLLDFSENLYDKELSVEILFTIRPEQKFSGISELKEQIAKDILFAKEKFVCYTV